MALKQAYKKLNYTAVFELQPEGCYTVTVPALPGCVTQGDTLEEAREMVKDAIQGYVESLLQDGLPVPTDKPVRSRHHHEKVSVNFVMA
jgi:predicted RNase H-like HicB family nuclease